MVASLLQGCHRQRTPGPECNTGGAATSLWPEASRRMDHLQAPRRLQEAPFSPSNSQKWLFCVDFFFDMSGTNKETGRLVAQPSKLMMRIRFPPSAYFPKSGFFSISIFGSRLLLA